jgi:hypothetical protein
MCTVFGSYGWGDGQWMRDWVDRMKVAGANLKNQKCIFMLRWLQKKR